MSLTIERATVPETPDFEANPDLEISEHARMAALVAAGLNESTDIESLHEQYARLHDASDILVARMSGRLAGLALYEVQFAGTHVGLSRLTILAVAPAYRGARQVGPRLLEETVATARAYGAPFIDLFCAEPRVPFYERNGFEQAGQVNMYYQLRRDLAV